jgi:cell division septation protein DedD
MSMSDDQSFYEIQLNTPHLVLAFLGATVLGVALFWLGVVIGRGQDELGGSPEWQTAVPGSLTGGETNPLELPEGADDESAAGAGAGDPAAGAETATAAAPAEELAAPEFVPSAPVDEQPAPVVAQSPAGLPRPDAALASGWIVQVRSTTDKPAADTLQAALVSAGFPAFVVSADVSGETYYRVRVGRYGSRSDAVIIEAELLGRSDIDTTWVTEG